MSKRVKFNYQLSVGVEITADINGIVPATAVSPEEGGDVEYTALVNYKDWNGEQRSIEAPDWLMCLLYQEYAEVEREAKDRLAERENNK